MESPIKFQFSKNILNQSRQSSSISSKPSPPSNLDYRSSYNPSAMKGSLQLPLHDQQESQMEAHMEKISQLQFNQQSREKFILTFNKNPLKSLSELCQQTPREIALILHSEPEISKNKLGELFGSPDEQAQEIFKEYLKVINFKNQTFDEALRTLLQLTKLPKEAQQIDRIVYSFAQEFNRQNENYFSVKEDAYILGYAILMLQTSLHNDKMKENDRMTLEQFIKNTKGATTGLNDDMLQEIYQRIKTNKFQTSASCNQNKQIKLIQVAEQTYEELIDCEAKEGTELLKMAVKLEKGDGFLRFYNNGKPKSRFVYLNIEENKIE